MRKYRRYIVWVLLIIVCVGGVVDFHRRNFMKTSDNMSLSYMPSVNSSVDQLSYFYVYDNTLYFRKSLYSYDDSKSGKDAIKYVKDNVIRTFAKIPGASERFIIISDKSLIVQWKDALHLVDASDGETTELWKGNCVGCYKDQVYFTDDNMLYSAKILEREPRAVLSFDELLAFDYNGITYRQGDEIYQYLLEHPEQPKLLTVGEIPWPKYLEGWLGSPELYTSDYALHISDDALDMYIYKTGEMRRIYESDGDLIPMAVVAREDELYVSRQRIDGIFWPVWDIKVNGTYKYDIQNNKWTKISNKTYSVIAQFDDQYLYCMDTYYLFDWVKRIKVD